MASNTGPVLGQLLKRWREAWGEYPRVSQAQAAEAAGVSLRAWQEYESGRAEPSLSVVEKFAASRGISLFALYRDLENLREQRGTVPIVDHIPAGPLVQGFGEMQTLGHVRFDSNDPQAFALVVRGASMSPEIQEGDIVILSPRAPFINGRIYAVVVGEGEQSLKRVRHDVKANAYALIPSNKEFPTLYVPEQQVLKLVRVVEVRRDLQ